MKEVLLPLLSTRDHPMFIGFSLLRLSFLCSDLGNSFFFFFPFLFWQGLVRQYLFDFWMSLRLSFECSSHVCINCSCLYFKYEKVICIPNDISLLVHSHNAWDERFVSIKDKQKSYVTNSVCFLWSYQVDQQYIHLHIQWH